MRPMDHPRSRGVYRHLLSAVAPWSGSSPLARGLRARDPFSHWEIGIIPARAGFTRPHRPGDHPRRDHPRSRGVYLAWRSMTVTGSGSSPLARGLRFLEALEFLIVRIIPARAGFTHSAVKCALWWSGSSPLARGLPVSMMNSSKMIGIIPARAGFTAVMMGRIAVTTDHPRSRGVYCS